jgi:hypothetical protein
VALIPVVSAGCVIVSGEGSEARGVGVLTNRLSTYLGDISYSLYLWHFPVAVFLVLFVARGSLLYYSVAVPLVLLLAVGSYHWVESPLRRMSWSRRRADPTSVHGIPQPRSGEPAASRRLLKPSLAVGVLVLLLGGGWLVLPRPVTPAQALATAGNACLGAASETAGCRGVDLGRALLPAVSAVQNDAGHAFSCWAAKNTSMASCHYGSTARKALRIALVGDSHAAMLEPALESQLSRHGWSLDTYVGYGCAWRTGSCPAMAQIQSRLTAGRPYDLVVTTAARQFSGTEGTVEQFVDAWRPVAARGTHVIVVADNPGVDPAALECVSRVFFSVRSHACATSETAAFAQEDPLPVAADRVDGAAVVDMRAFYCARSSCPAVIGNVLVYRDTYGHISGTWSRTLGPYLVAEILRQSGR